MKQNTMKLSQVEYIPDALEEGIIYVSLPFKTAVHKCCCGCGYEVVTPIGPTDWKARIENGTISLYPSIGNWSLACKSHYWIKKNRVEWALPCNQQQIDATRAHDRLKKQKYFESPHTQPAPDRALDVQPQAKPEGIWAKIKKWWTSLPS